jgi:putative sigma-54 modulation protein|tara:strand:- start:223 stop:573 length:351 start_codon:yes stop_codon:yes gene_type:complete
MKNNLILSGIHLDLTDALKNIVQEKIDKLFKHEENIIRARIELEYDARSNSHEKEYIAKGHLELKGSTITISSESDNLYKSIDELINKLDRGLRRRSRLQVVKRKQGSLNSLPEAA